MKRFVPSEAIFHCDFYHPYLCHILTLVGEHSSVLHTVQLRSPCICPFVTDGKDKMKFENIRLNDHHVIRPSLDGDASALRAEKFVCEKKFTCIISHHRGKT